MTALKSLLQFGSLALLLALGGCGGGSSGGSTAEGGMGGSGSGSGQYAEGGMGGSGSGTSSGYGSIFVNDNRRHYPIDANADVFLDGERVAPESINPVDRGLPLGMTLEFLLAGDANADLTGGTAIRIRADHRVIGPVTGIHPLEVLGQPVLVTSETLLEGITESGVDSLAVGQVLKVDGLVNHAGVIRATRLEQPSTVLPQWQLIGHVSGVDPAGFSIEGQRIDLNGVVPQDCPATLVDEEVLVRATKPSDPAAFAQGGDSLTTVLSVRCLPEGLSLFSENPPEQRQTLPATVDAIITGAPDLDLSDGEITLDLNGQQVLVRVDQLVEILSGSLGQLQLGTRIEVDGTLDTGTGVITAERIRFRDPLITLIAPVDGGIADRLLLALGVEVRPTPGMQGAALFQTPGSLGQVGISGFITDNNVIYAETVTEQGAADPADVDFTGPVTGVDDGTTSVTLFTNKVFDTAAADSIGLLDATGSLIDSLLCQLLCLSEPPELEGRVPVDGSASGAVTGASWDAVGSRLEGGDLRITLPPESSSGG